MLILEILNANFSNLILRKNFLYQFSIENYDILPNKKTCSKK